MSETEPNEVIKQMRAQLDALSTDLNLEKAKTATLMTERDTFKTKAETYEREKMSDIDRVNSEKAELTTKITSLTEQIATLSKSDASLRATHEFLKTQYDSKLAAIKDENTRNTLKSLTLIDSDPVTSVQKLDLQLSLLQTLGGNGIITNPVPPGQTGEPLKQNGETKIDPLTLGWNTALKTAAELKAGKQTQNQ